MEIATHPIESQVISRGRLAYGVEEKNEATISLKTQEGDTVNLSFHSLNSYSKSASETRSQDGSVALELSAQALSSSKYSMIVQGDLNEKEMAEIKKLADTLTPIAQNFFSNSDFSLKDAAQSLGGTMEEIQSVQVRLEQTITESFSEARVFRSGQNDNGQPSTTTGEKPATGQPAENPPKPEDGIRSPAALANAVVESVFQKEGEKSAQSDPVLLQALSDVMDYLHEKLSQFFEPLKKRVHPDIQDPAKVTEQPAPQPEATNQPEPVTKPDQVAA